MAKITLSYPASGLTIAIVVKNRATGTTEFSGTMTEIATSSIYKYDFTEVAGNDYVYTATNATYPTISGTLYDDSAISSDSISMAQAVRTELSPELARIDKKISDVLGGGGSFTHNHEVKPKWIKELLDEQKKEIIDTLYEEPEDKEKFDLSPIIDKIEEIEKPDDKIEKEVLKKVDKIEKWIDKETIKEKKEKDKKEKERIKRETKEKKEQEKILSAINKIEESMKERQEIEKAMDEEETKNILKLLK